MAVKVLDKGDEHKARGKNLWQMMSTKKRPKAKSVNARARHADPSDEYQSEAAEENKTEHT
jgi:hypothetical protein